MEGVFYVNDPLEKLMFEELRNACRGGGECVGEPRGASRPLTECLLLVFYQFFFYAFFLLLYRCGRVFARYEADWECGSAAGHRSCEWLLGKGRFAVLLWTKSGFRVVGCSRNLPLAVRSAHKDRL